MLSARLPIIVLFISLSSSLTANHVIGWTVPKRKSRIRLAAGVVLNNLNTTFEQEFPYPEKRDFNQIEKLIGQFNSTESAKREEASKEIRKFGRKALPQLKDAMKSDKIEVRKRALEEYREIMDLYTKDISKNLLTKLMQKQLNEFIITKSMTKSLMKELQKKLSIEESEQMKRWSTSNDPNAYAKASRLMALILGRIKGIKVKRVTPELVVDYLGRELRMTMLHGSPLMLIAPKYRKFTFDLKRALIESGWSTPFYRTTINGYPIVHAKFPQMGIQELLSVHRKKTHFSVYSQAMVKDGNKEFLTFEVPVEDGSPRPVDAYFEAYKRRR